MTKRPTIDPTPIVEEIGELGKYRKALQGGEEAAHALIWMANNILPEYRAEDVLSASVRFSIGNPDNPHREMAQKFLERALVTRLEEILEDAMSLARQQFETQEQMRKNVYQEVHRQIREKLK